MDSELPGKAHIGQKTYTGSHGHTERSRGKILESHPWSFPSCWQKGQRASTLPPLSLLHPSPDPWVSDSNEQERSRPQVPCKISGNDMRKNESRYFCCDIVWVFFCQLYMTFAFDPPREYRRTTVHILLSLPKKAVPDRRKGLSRALKCPNRWGLTGGFGGTRNSTRHFTSVISVNSEGWVFKS